MVQGAGLFEWAPDDRAGVPVSEQLREHLIAGVKNGSLVSGSPLPPVRRLAEQLGLAANTVAKVYRELERDGFVVTRGRNGTSIAPTGEATAGQAQLAALAYVDRIRELALSDADAVAAVESALRAR